METILHSLFNSFILVISIFASNASATVILDEVLSGRSFQSTALEKSGIRNGIVTNSGQITNAAERTPASDYMLATNAIASQFIMQKSPSKPADETHPGLLFIAGIGLLLFIVRRRSSY